MTYHTVVRYVYCGCFCRSRWIIGVLAGTGFFFLVIVILIAVKFLKFKYFGKLGKDAPEENEVEMKYDAFFCFRFVLKFYFSFSSEV